MISICPPRFSSPPRRFNAMYARWDRGYIAPSTLLWIVREEELCVGWAGANQPLDIASSANHTLQRIPQIRPPLIRQYFRALLELHQCYDFDNHGIHSYGRSREILIYADTYSSAIIDHFHVMKMRICSSQRETCSSY